MSEKRRKRVLPAGWYPESEKETIKVLEGWEKDLAHIPSKAERKAVSVVVPHAGWPFSGKLAFRAMLYLIEDCDTVIIAGGHMHGGEGVVAAEEPEFETPFGPASADSAFIEELSKNIELSSDRVPDNTVEVNIPLVRYLYPKAKIVWLRTGAGSEAIRLGEACAAAADKIGRSAALIGSTDLTHYGPNFRFTPAGVGREAYRWVKEENDKKIVDAMLSMESDKVLHLGNEDKSACSAGAAVAAIEFARHYEVSKGELVGYSSSYEIHPDDSFVGYAGIYYSSEDN
ncbi:MAG: AmmeMemoRadiSam system protein B [Spirochaetia bacterium]